MYNYTVRYIVAAIFILSAQVGHCASWYFFDPGLGYYQGHYNANKVSGIGFDFKLGFNWGNMFLGADIGYAQDLNISNVTYELDFMSTGAVIGYNANPLRIWYTMVSGATNSYKDGATEYVASGNGYKLGIGGKVSGSTYINLETNFLEYEELSTDGTKSDVDYYMDLVLLSISWPTN